MMKGHGHGGINISSSHPPHRIPSTQPAQPPPHSRNPHDAPAAIASRSKQPPIAVSHRSRSRLRRHPFEAVGRRWQQRHATEAQQIDHGHSITSKARHANVPRRRNHDITRQASSPVGSPSPDTKSGERRRDDEGRTGKGEANDGEWTSSSGKQATTPRQMTSPTTSR